jgi:MSHA pilin protein MshC
MKYSSSRSKGFTIIELVIVTILLGILAIVALPRLFDQTGFQETGFYQDVINAFRYAQKTAIASGCDVQASYDSVSRQYAVYFRSGGTDTSCGAGSFSEFVRSPQDNSNYTGTGPSGISSSGTLSVVFDAAGSPSNSGSFNIGNKTINVAPVTGYVY